MSHIEKLTYPVINVILIYMNYEERTKRAYLTHNSIFWMGNVVYPIQANMEAFFVV